MLFLDRKYRIFSNNQKYIKIYYFEKNLIIIFTLQFKF